MVDPRATAPDAGVPDAARDEAIDPELEAAWSAACNGIYRVLKRGRGTVGSRAGGASLTEAQVAMLESVATRGALPVGVIAREAGIAQPTVTRMLKTLERRGVVRREPSPTDSRVMLTELTDEGRELWRQKHDLLHYFQRDALLQFAPHERDQAVDMLTRLVAIIEEQIAER